VHVSEAEKCAKRRRLRAANIILFAYRDVCLDVGTTLNCRCTDREWTPRLRRRTAIKQPKKVNISTTF